MNFYKDREAFNSKQRNALKCIYNNNKSSYLL